MLFFGGEPSKLRMEQLTSPLVQFQEAFVHVDLRSSLAGLCVGAHPSLEQCSDQGRIAIPGAGKRHRNKEELGSEHINPS